jgi:protocatechuate 3,4-dioxygenase beta subunit
MISLLKSTVIYRYTIDFQKGECAVLIKDSEDIIHQDDNEPREAQTNDAPAGCNGRLTPSLEEGPFYKTGSPERTSIAERGTVGSKLVVEGYVFDRNCRPIAHAWLDFWQADGRGAYDNAGYNLRGHQYTDESGRYHLETVRPVEYGPRTAHIHAKVRANDNSPILTVQLFLKGEKRNQTDPIFDSSLVMNIVDADDGEKATYDFVLNAD